jgi:hypothetical protein
MPTTLHTVALVYVVQYIPLLYWILAVRHYHIDYGNYRQVQQYWNLAVVHEKSHLTP